MNDIGSLTYGIWANASDLFDRWRKEPACRDKFGVRELQDLEEARNKIADLEQFILIHQNRKLKGVA